MNSDRRDLLKLTLAAGLLATSSGGRANAALPPDIGSKFHPDGRVRPFAGNTIICHLPQQGENAACFNALLDLYRLAPAYRFMRKVALLPPSSYHMTIFGGANDQPRKRESWPSDLPIDMSMPACSAALAERLRHFHPGIRLPIRLRIRPKQVPEIGRALTFALDPVDEAERRKLSDLRDRLADVMKIRAAGHDSYQFHISIGYPIGWFDSAETEECNRAWQDWADRIARISPEVLLDAPEYCTFADMFAFHRLFYLGRPA